MTQPEPSSRPQSRTQPRPSKINYACEACRTSKVKCQPGTQPGICKRCSEFKRECVFRTGPRTRRPKASHAKNPISDAGPLPPPPGPSQTFSIDFTMPNDDDLHDDFDDLREKHERFIEGLMPSSEEDEGGNGDGHNDPALFAAEGGRMFDFNDLSVPTPASAAAKSTSRSVSSLGIKPRFNLDSAEKLLRTFRAMLPFCPCIVLPDGADVRSLARDSPFVLLSLLAVTSCSISLQGHSLYDEEFRKILALKFVAGGERSIELLQGLIIYSSWYPFHLRPKNRQLMQYLRMSIDIVHDLKLDEESHLDLATLPPERKAAKLQSMRAYLSCFYHTSVYAWAWSRPYNLRYTPWMAKCCDALEQHSEHDQDHILVWLVRLQYVLNEFEELHRSYKKADGNNQNEHHRQLIRAGLEMQLRDFQTRIPSHLSTTPSILMASLTGDAFLLAAPLMQTIRPRLDDGSALMVDASKLQAAAYTARAYFDYVASLRPAQLSYFSGGDITRLILTVILAYRLSFPMPFCPAYDYAQGRRILDFGTYLAELAGREEEEKEKEGADGADGAPRGDGVGGRGAPPKRVDVVSALRVVLGALKASFDKKTAMLEAAAEENKRARLCPMFDGSLDQYLPQWEGQQDDGVGTSTGTGNGNRNGNSNSNGPSGSSYAMSSHSGQSSATMPVCPTVSMSSQFGGEQALHGGLPGSKQMLFHDLWATMTMGWATDLDGNMQPGPGMSGMSGTEEYVDLMGMRGPPHDL